MIADANMLPSTAPNIFGMMGKAWLPDTEGMKRRHPADAEEIARRMTTTVGCWIVYAPWANPFWHSYVIHIIHLRPQPGCPDADIVRPGSTHEIAVHALCPEFPILLDDYQHKLNPPNFMAQFEEPSDAAAVERGRVAVQQICDGVLNPDTDAIRQWMERFGDSHVKRTRGVSLMKALFGGGSADGSGSVH